MGALSSRQNAGVEEVDIASNQAYKYPPRSGNYFGTHFIMGGERFDTPQPEAYLFGENSDLNFLGNKPTPFPYPPPQANEPTKTLKSLVNIRKESLRFVRVNDVHKPDEELDSNGKSTRFNIEFVFDSDAKCAITIHYFCSEDLSVNGVVYTCRNIEEVSLKSETYHYNKGANQQFIQPAHIFDPSKFTDNELTFSVEKEVIPIAIHCVVEEGIEEQRQSHTTIAVVEKHSDGTFVLKALKQKLFVDGLCYLLQEIYGIENKNNDTTKVSGEEDFEDNGSECVICMCDIRDTLILPCRHLCLCNSCADSLRYQANNCPICRAPFRALLQIRALQRCQNMVALNQPIEGSCENIPAGYEAVSLIEALNGPCVVRSVQQATNTGTCNVDSPNNEVAMQAAEILNRPHLDRSSNSHNQESLRHSENKENRHFNQAPLSPEFRMTVLLAKDERNYKDVTSTQSPLLTPNNIHRGSEALAIEKDSVKIDTDQIQDQDSDSEAEKLSPLLNAATMTSMEILPLNIEGVVDSIDDNDTDIEELEMSMTKSHKDSMKERKSRPALNDVDSVVLAPGEDSDYYTPEDPQTTIFSPLYLDKSGTENQHGVTNQGPVSTSLENTPHRWNFSVRREAVNSMPGTPQSTASHASNRSSGDSYSSSSSTRHLLTIAPNNVSVLSTKNGNEVDSVGQV